MLRHKILACILILAGLAAGRAGAADRTKREFRGAWLHTVYQGQYARQTTEENQAYLRGQLDKLKAAGVNAVLFQVRPSADAFYASELEPWSRFLTGTAGKAPVPFWDPLEFMVEETHKRGMELHAWLNPYRATTAKKERLPRGHLALKEPGRFVTYADGKKYFDPGLPENREFIARVVGDIVRRYDVDAIHFDDYFYPYPVAKAEFPDGNSYAKYGRGLARADWRRKNVDLLIEQVSDTIRSAKPWVRFGISPFGIWRNKKSDPRGSETNGLENYDSLYADVLLWAEKGWIDYLLPQLYWTMDNKAAAYGVLLPWWDAAVPEGCQLYIGQDVERTMKAGELDTKLALMDEGRRVDGLCWWPGYYVSDDLGGVATELSHPDRHGRPAIVPEYPRLSSEAPMRPEELRQDGDVLRWTSKSREGKAADAVKFALYRLGDGDEAELVALTGMNSCPLPGTGTYMVTALSRTNIESVPSAILIVK
ncbi:MAG: family 10 glycosylhydrolase [Muribaculaceae bacterium]|nr:family 10 glycosylhydrolase [Muribaculaceae bacterium]